MARTALSVPWPKPVQAGTLKIVVEVEVVVVVVVEVVADPILVEVVAEAALEVVVMKSVVVISSLILPVEPQLEIK